MKTVAPVTAIEQIPDGATVVMPGGVAEPRDLFTAFSDNVTRFSGLTLVAGFGFGNYSYLARGLGENFRFLTWQASPKLRALFAENDPRKIGFVPLRLGDVTRVVRKGGEINPDVVIIQTSVPQADGTVSLGVSVGPYLDIVRDASLVIAEFNHNMPVTAGDSRIPLTRIDVATESDQALCTYSTPAPKPRDEQIIAHLMTLIPDHATVQIGIGAVPENALAHMADHKGVRILSGLLTESLEVFLERCTTTPVVLTGELAGSQAFYDYCGRTSCIRMGGTGETHDVARLAKLPRFISINSAIEIDLQGQSNGECLGRLQLSGAGGSMEYVEAAFWSPQGRSIIALPATTEDGKHSKIVAHFAAGTPVTTPRFCVDCVVTEYGVAKLKGRDLHARAQALIEIAHPDFRAALARDYGARD